MPDIGVTIAAVALTVGVALFVVYLDRFVHSLRPLPSRGTSPAPAPAFPRSGPARAT